MDSCSWHLCFYPRQPKPEEAQLVGSNLSIHFSRIGVPVMELGMVSVLTAIVRTMILTPMAVPAVLLLLLVVVVVAIRCLSMAD